MTSMKLKPFFWNASLMERASCLHMECGPAGHVDGARGFDQVRQVEGRLAVP